MVALAADYDTFERMHWVCFHYEIEHDPADPDEACNAGGCPSGVIAGGRAMAVATAERLAREAADDPAWGNNSLARYLEAFGAWLADSDGYYLNQRRTAPSNAWEVVNDALQAAAIYE